MSQEAARKSSLSLQAISALGNIHPDLAWLQIRTSFAGAIQDYSKAAENLAKAATLPETLESLQAAMEKFHPVPAINFLVESNPELSLRDIPHLPPLTILKAVLKTQMTNERLASS